MAARKLRLPFTLADLRANGVTRFKYVGHDDGIPFEVELELSPTAPPAKAEKPFEAAWAEDGEANQDGPEPEDEGDPRFLLEKIAVANSRTA